jgi:archaetidylinositol phosphate synthase
LSDIISNNKKRVKQKELLNRFIDKPVKFLIRHHISPNSLSYLGFCCALLAAFFIAIRIIHNLFWFAWLVPFFLFLAGSLDVFDGEVARRTGSISKSGAFLDSNLDRISDATLILGLIFGGFINFLFGYIIMFLFIMISYIRAKAENEGIDMKGIGFMERAERIILLLIALILESFIFYCSKIIMGKPWTIYLPFITSVPVTWFFLIFIIGYTILLIMTVDQRLSYTFKYLKQSDNRFKMEDPNDL